jgi:tRNA(adenine34) deaminase
MGEALREARSAFDRGEVPVGAVIVREGRILGRGHNRVERLHDATAHAEIIAIGAAARTVGDWRLEGATLYSTLEPCLMCAGAIDAARLGRLVYAAADPRKGAFGSALDVRDGDRFCRFLAVDYGTMAAEASALMREFFARRRAGSPRPRPGAAPDADRPFMREHFEPFPRETD